MSLYEKSSLVLIPSGTKTGKVFSQKPVNGDGDFTFTRASAATRVGADGFIEKETSNSLLQSNQFDTTWTTSNASVTSGQSGYDGSNDAWLLNKSSAGGSLRQDITITGVNNFSAYVKAGSLNWLRIATSTGFVGCWINVLDGVFGSVSSGIIGTNIESAGNNFYRISISFSDSISNFQLLPAEGNNVLGASGNIYIQDAQLNQGLVTQPYQETTTTAVYGGITDNTPRLDYTDSSCPALLLEPQRTNVVENSEYHSGSTYANNNVSVSDNQAVSPEGVQNAAKIVLDSGTNSINGGHYFTYTSTPSEKYTISVFAKAAGYRYFTFTYGSTSAAGAHFDLQEGVKLGDITNAQYTNTSASIEDYGNGWYRLIVSTTDTSTAGRFLSMRPSPSASVPANNNYPSTGDGASGAYIYGFQVEASASYATSYIPTYGSSVTRIADDAVVNYTEISDTGGTLFYQGFTEVDSDSHLITLSDSSGASGTNRILFYRSLSDKKMWLYIQSAGVSVKNISLELPTDSNDKYAVAWATNDFAVYINGVQEYTSSTGAIPTGMQYLQLNEWNNAHAETNIIKQALYFPTRLSNAELADLTTL